MSRFHINMSSSRWRRLRLVVFRRDGYRCKACGGSRRLECDHVHPVARGGAEWETENLQALCRSCHRVKTRNEQGQKDRPAGVLAWDKLLESGL